MPETYDLQFVALIFLGIFAGGATVGALIMAPLCYARGKRDGLHLIRRGPSIP